MAVADLVIFLEVERLAASDLRTLRIYKMRGEKYTEGPWAFYIDDDGIQFLGSPMEQPQADLSDTADLPDTMESMWPRE